MWWWSLLDESSFRNGRSGEVSCTKYSFHWPAKLGFVRLSHIQYIVHEFIAIMHASTCTCSTCTCSAIRILLQYHSYMYMYMYTPHLPHRHCKHSVCQCRMHCSYIYNCQSLKYSRGYTAEWFTGLVGFFRASSPFASLHGDIVYLEHGTFCMYVHVV